jgi:hypothetical protein
MERRRTKEGDVAAVRRGECPKCGGRLTDPSRSPGGYSHCARCRVGWRIEEASLGDYVHHRGWPPRRR